MQYHSVAKAIGVKAGAGLAAVGLMAAMAVPVLALATQAIGEVLGFFGGLS